MGRHRTWIALSLGLAASACATDPAEKAARKEPSSSEPEESTQRPEMPFELLEGEPMYTVLPQDAIPAIDEPRFLFADEADAVMAPDEPVLGVVGVNGTAKAYSAWQLDAHEIVNDSLDGQPIAATW